jgi:hypothetical protein
MPESIALALNVYNDAAALRGALETGSRFFDNIFCVHSGPGGAYSTDGTIELLEKFGATIVYDDIEKGYGTIRSRCLHECGCTFAAILDADERFFPELPVLHCEGTDKWSPSWEGRPNLSVHVREGTVKQGDIIRQLINDPNVMSIRCTRRHWFDFSMKHPTQNWLHERDHQLRIVRNIPEIFYKSDVKMHERLFDSRRGGDPAYNAQDDYQGPFIDHFHPFFRHAYPGTKERNELNYARLESGEPMVVT